MQSQVFFFISSVGFIVLFALIGWLVIKIITAMETFQRILDKVEAGVDKIGDTTKEVMEDLQDSTVYRVLVGKKKRERKSTKKKEV
jgi:hypothetical protein